MGLFIPSVGIEVHAELHTRSKMFCRCEVAFGGEPNTRTCPVCLGLPGSLPVINAKAVEMVLRTAVALNCKIAKNSIFHRKNYFYPDLPKGYQISQYGETNPIGYDGWIEIPTPDGPKRIRIQRVHLEEDTGKLMHLPSGGSGVDFNRSGVPLMEVVTAFPPDIASAAEAREYVSQLRQLLVYLKVCDGKMEEGSLRCEPNISIRPGSDSKLGTKTELKNLGSFRSLVQGIEFEIRRQTEVLESNGTVLQETRGWNENTESSFVMRTKEAENDYRYFPDPDLVPMFLSDEKIEGARQSLPELPLARAQRYTGTLGLTAYEANWLIADPEFAEYFEEAIRLGGDPKKLFNWVSGDLARHVGEIGGLPNSSANLVTPKHLVVLIQLIDSGEISGKIAKDVFKEMAKSGVDPAEHVEKSGLKQVLDETEVIAWITEVFEQHPEPVEKARAGQLQVLGYLVGQVMRVSQGRANPALVQERVREMLETKKSDGNP